ncbi:MAG: hypothetical protein IPL61_09985 [Myxococcales bacterium]|nr:hypothetical protein [Myxococcales bacterium]
MIRLASLVAAVALAAAPAPAAARTQTTVGYAADRVFAATVRFLRIDLDAKILDKDAAAGYVVFEYVDDGKPFRASFEVVTTERDGKPTVAIVLDISDRPAYLEAILIDRLRAKLRADLGDEPRPAPAPAPAPAPKPAPPTGAG